jgi:flagellar motor switch protein FliN/FliY
MSDMLSQAEIDALLKGASIEDGTDEAESDAEKLNLLTNEERDALGEVGNISMGTSATTLYALLGKKVSITTPKVEETTWNNLIKMFKKPYVAVKVQFTNGLNGFNLLIMEEDDVKIITDLMMGGDGGDSTEAELNEIHISAISEAMNQMIGSAATSLSTMFEKRVDISPPISSRVDSNSELDKFRVDEDENVVVVKFSLKVGDLIDSQFLQIMPVDFARELVANLMQAQELKGPMMEQPYKSEPSETPQAPPHETPEYSQTTDQLASTNAEAHMTEKKQVHEQQQQPAYTYTNQYAAQPQHGYGYHQEHVNVQPVQFQTFGDYTPEISANNIELLMDVPLQVAVELGRTTKKIREILEFGQGSIIELDKLAGEPVDIMVNGKAIAKGEVVVIDESFGVRITDILHPSKRL